MRSVYEIIEEEKNKAKAKTKTKRNSRKQKTNRINYWFLKNTQKKEK